MPGIASSKSDIDDSTTTVVSFGARNVISFVCLAVCGGVVVVEKESILLLTFEAASVDKAGIATELVQFSKRPQISC